VTERARVVIHGAVQGVGFRPFVYRLATEMALAGWVLNSSQGVFIEVEGEKPALDVFLLRLERERPPRASVQSLEVSFLDPVSYGSFEIRESDAVGEATTLVLPDIATCADCLREILDRRNRRYRYPFTNCTNCGPRFTIIEALPYDRANTSMRTFAMCPACEQEYRDPRDRRFHAQPNACPACGPSLQLWEAHGEKRAGGDEALLGAIEAVRAGQVVAVKGIGGFLLFADAARQDVVERLRARKHREEKPFAVLYPALEAIEADCHVSPLEARLLASPEAPIVLLRRRDHARRTVADAVAPHNPFLGAMLPYAPLHHLLLHDLGRPVVATSGNISDEPICTNEREAVDRLRGIADLFLVHDRPIVRHVDDSIVRVMLGRELVLRRARGYAPLPLPLRAPSAPMLAVGGHLKNTVALAVDRNVFVSQHIGDLETAEALEAFRRVIRSFADLYRVAPERVVADWHPDYLSTKHAQALGPPVTQVQHHYAHVAACMAENDLDGRVLGVSWDGTGHGLDGTIWGGEFLLTTDTSFTRVATLRPFRLPGGERAIKEPRRSALGLLHAMWGDRIAGRLDLAPVAAFAPAERSLLLRMLAQGLNTPLTTSAGRLFDAVASLVGLRQQMTFEGQAAMELEFSLCETEPAEHRYPFEVGEPAASPGSAAAVSPGRVIDWQPTVEAILGDVAQRTSVGVIAARFHHTLADVIVEVARRVGEPRVVLTGGCFQNRYLTEQAVARLIRAGFRPYWHQRIPPNDGGLAVGQIAAALRAQRAEDSRQETRDGR
jgi:hydrogenase maturation protein HypF